MGFRRLSARSIPSWNELRAKLDQQIIKAPFFPVDLFPGKCANDRVGTTDELGEKAKRRDSY